MKNSILLLFVVSISLATRAQQSSKQEIINFLKDRESSFNTSQKFVESANLDSIVKIVKRRKWSYSRSIYVFNGQTVNDNLIVGSSQTIIGDKKVPFIYYKVTKGDFGNLKIEVLTGSDSL